MSLRPERTGTIKASDQNKIGKCTFRAEKFHSNTAMNACAYALYSKLELIWPQLHTESCIPFLHILKYDHSLSRVRK